jgi:molybdopterin converting factor small subunit
VSFRPVFFLGFFGEGVYINLMGDTEVKNTVKIRLRYLVSVRDKTGLSDEETVFPAGSTLRNLAGWLMERYGLSVPGPHVMAILNGRGWGQHPLKLDTPLEDGDAVSLFPPIAGG